MPKPNRGFGTLREPSWEQIYLGRSRSHLLLLAVAVGALCLFLFCYHQLLFYLHLFISKKKESYPLSDPIGIGIYLDDDLSSSSSLLVLLLSMIIVIVVSIDSIDRVTRVGGGFLTAKNKEFECMRDLLCWRDCGFVIRSRSRWGKCGWWFLLNSTCICNCNCTRSDPISSHPLSFFFSSSSSFQFQDLICTDSLKTFRQATILSEK